MYLRIHHGRNCSKSKHQDLTKHEFKIDMRASATILPYNKELPQLIQSNI